MIDSDGYRKNVGIIVSNNARRVFWCKRVGQDAWQFPQGGIQESETLEQALFRELHEETGLRQEDVKIIGRTQEWLRYKLPRHLVRRHLRPCCIGQKQIWFMLRLVSNETQVRLDASNTPEFDRWCWVDYWRPMEEVVFFKRKVYKQALNELAPLIFDDTDHSEHNS